MQAARRWCASNRIISLRKFPLFLSSSAPVVAMSVMAEIQKMALPAAVGTVGIVYR
jgi:hypothetical protein